MIMKAVVYLMCGLPGSGKTTLAKRLESESRAMRFSIDEWMLNFYGEIMSRAEFDERSEQCEKMIWNIAERLLLLGFSVILDFGFWKREKRREYQTRINKAGAHMVLYYVQTPYEVLQRRLETRNKKLPDGAFYISAEMLQVFVAQFEYPTEAEGFEMIEVRS